MNTVPTGSGSGSGSATLYKIESFVSKKFNKRQFLNILDLLLLLAKNFYYFKNLTQPRPKVKDAMSLLTVRKKQTHMGKTATTESSHFYQKINFL
jgi:hypothetical protein